ncbi:hypothetical protein [Pseudomonas putida]|uniref:Uncharacterized protein n=1 Tax=Pseudomonas putida TaxID=303 RepID=A0A1Q9R398_PSEPU|nr:hypothetical protein [Pseudomonas putida]OLS61772.1 hypothetical protein PSEMO_33160 [Pseudomonas putida]
MRKVDGRPAADTQVERGSPELLSTVRWVLLVLLCLATGFGLVMLFWSGDMQPESPWYWNRVLALPLIVGGYLYGVRWLALEGRDK